MTPGKRPITASDLEDLFEEAAHTLRRLPNPPGSGPKGYGSSWPEYIQMLVAWQPSQILPALRQAKATSHRSIA